jgi:hypothetical protein
MKSVMPCTRACDRRSPTVGGARPCRAIPASCCRPWRALGLVGDLQQALGRIGAAVQHHVFHALAQLGLQVVVHADHAGVDDAHVHAGRNRVVQEHGVDGLAHRVVAAERERHVGHAAGHLGTGQVLLDPARGLDEIDAVVVVLFDAGGHGKDVGVEDDVLGREAHLIDQHAVGALADLDLALVGVGLAFLVKGHHHGGRAIALDQLGVLLEFLDAFLHGDGVDDALALQAAQAGLDHLPLGAVHHHRHLGDVGLGGNQVQKAHHGRLAVQHGLVHVHVDHLGAVFHLLARHGQGFFVLLVQDQARKGLGAGDVGALAHVDEQRVLADEHGLQARQAHGRNGDGDSSGHRTHLCENNWGSKQVSAVACGRAAACRGPKPDGRVGINRAAAALLGAKPVILRRAAPPCLRGYSWAPTTRPMA